MARLGERHLPWPDQYEDEPRCSGCGTEMSNETDGCSVCNERQSKRRRRAEYVLMCAIEADIERAFINGSGA